jgi:uncharacterized protein (TIRG00374 family)
MRHRRSWLVAQALISAVLLATVFRSVDVGAFSSLFARLPLWFYVVSLAVTLAGQTLYAWRWHLVLAAAGVDAPFSVVLRQYFIGIFFNNFLPSTIGGDVGKVYLLGREYGYRLVTTSIIVDRILGLGVLALCATAALWSLTLTADVLVLARYAVTAVAAACLGAVLLMVAGTGGLHRRVAWLGERAVGIARRLQQVRVDAAQVIASPLLMVQATGVVLAYFAAVTVLYQQFIAMQTGTAPPLASLAGVVMATSVLSNVPVSLNGLGLREQLHASLLAPLAVSTEVAVAISLLLYVHLLVGSLLGLVFWMQVGPVSSASVPAGE